MSETQLEVSIRVEGELAIIDLQGEINAFAEAALINAYMEASSTEAKSLALDFTDVDYINSTGIALIVSLLAKARKDKQEVLAFGLQRLVGANARDVDAAVDDRGLEVEEAVGHVRHLHVPVVDLDRARQVEVVPKGHLLVAHDGDLPHLPRIQPAHVHVSQHFVGKAERREHRVLDARVEVRLPPGGHAGWRGVDEVGHDRDVVAREIPQGVDVGPHRTEVGP